MKTGISYLLVCLQSKDGALTQVATTDGQVREVFGSASGIL
jgi:hypothetical protein